MTEEGSLINIDESGQPLNPENQVGQQKLEEARRLFVEDGGVVENSNVKQQVFRLLEEAGIDIIQNNALPDQFREVPGAFKVASCQITDSLDRLTIESLHFHPYIAGGEPLAAQISKIKDDQGIIISTIYFVRNSDGKYVLGRGAHSNISNEDLNALGYSGVPESDADSLETGTHEQHV